MPKVYKVKARTDRYYYGAKIVDSKTKKGYRIDKSRPRDESDTIFCKKGEIYYHFTKYRSATTYTREYPKPSQLTGSDFLQQVYSISENFETPKTIEELECWKEETIDELQSLLDDTDDKLNNMPDSLQSSPTGELLQSRIDSLQDWIDELDSLDCDLDTDEDDWKANYKEETGEDDDDDIQASWEEYVAEQIDEKVSSINLDYQGE